MRKLLSLSVLVGALTLGGCAQGIGYGGGYQQPTRIDFAKVLSVQQVATGGSWGYGAAIGGTAGVLTGGGHSTESKLVRGALGALAGAAVNKAVTSGQEDTQVVVQLSNGSRMNVKHSSRDLTYGDCVQVETRYGGDIRLYRASPTQCNF